MKTSPTATKKLIHQLDLKFPEAMQEVMDGHKVTKREWGNPEICVSLFEGFLRIYDPKDNKWHPLQVSDGDMLGTDWVIKE